MSDQCLASTLCRFHPESNGYCVRHKDHASGVSVKVKEPIAKQSDQIKKDNKQLKQDYQLFLSLPGNKKCTVQYPGCTKAATVVHHKMGRGKDVKFDQRFWLATCPSCNGQIEAMDGQAREDLYKLSKFATKESNLLATPSTIPGVMIVEEITEE
jgi:hypothetical protein